MKEETTAEKTDEVEKIVSAAKECLEGFEERESDNINRAKEAIEFRAGKQWPDQIRRDRENESQEGGARPCPVLDKTNQYVRQIVNEERQNRAAIKIRPVDDYSDPEIAEIYTGIIRHIEDQSEAIVAYTTGGEQAIDGGFGYWRLLTDYCDDMSFDQDIIIKRIPNRFSVALGVHTESDASDMKEALIWEDVRREDFKKEYPKAKEVGFSQGESWSDKDTIRIAEYYCIKPEAEKIHLMDDGSTLTDKQLKELIAGVEGFNDGLAGAYSDEDMEPEYQPTPEPVKTRDTVINKIKWYKITSEEILEQKDIPGKYIPVVKVTGNEITMPDGKTRVSGVLDTMMEPQRLHNYAHAGFIEHVALAPRAPWIAEEEQVEGYEGEYADANRKPITLLKYKSKSDDGHLIPPPQRTPPAGIAPGWQQMLANTEHAVEAAVGMYGPSVGAISAERSGIALQEQKIQGMVGNFHFPDNLARSIQHTGRILLDWIPVYYDTARVVRIMGEDGEHEMIKINPEQEKAIEPELNEYDQEIGQIYNLGIGKYDVTVSTGPSYTAKRQEAVDTQTQIISAAPQLLNVMGDILFKNMDAPGTDEISERLKALLPPEVKQLEEAKEQNINPETQAAMQQIQQAAQMIEQKGMELADYERVIKEKAMDVNADQTNLDSDKKELDSMRKVFMAEVKAQKAQLELTGNKIVDQVEDVTDPVMRELASQTKTAGEGEEKAAVQDPAMQEVLQAISELNIQAQQQVAATVSDALDIVSQAMTQPRQTRIIRDEEGNPISSVSEPYGG